MATVQDLVRELAENMGLDDLDFDVNAVASVQFDDLVVNILADDTSREITLFLKIGEIPAAQDEKLAVYSYLLKKDAFALHTGGGVLGIDEEELAAYFSHRIPADMLTVPHLEKILEAFLNLADSLIVGYADAVKKPDNGSATRPDGMRV